ncbi:hypothetical protein I203_100050 [Kwoniella mangroviensis CBS 8507]|uniref:uncharacterized protein n=1 Tax=Kwoniella mangroviensis CBS 8507 TaxID=1296122 RepID=UPI00080CD321|nr:uncharacterized protein I203_07987 [Kwoniella mangroviensis CBS 8507]OCF63006.1 hypothetical protein I203_07987 [Kwoniella mangroviensis CBS 8507]
MNNKTIFLSLTSLGLGLGDSWAVKIPKDLLIGHLLSDGKDEDIGQKWNKAFWMTWPLRLEGRSLGSIVRMIRSRSNEEVEERKEVDMSEEGYKVNIGQTVVNGLFTIESIDQIPFHLLSSPTSKSTSTSTQITYSWGNLSPASPTNPSSWISISIRGGYHTLSVLSEPYLNSQVHSSKEKQFSSRSDSGNDDYVYLVFTAQGISSTSSSSNDQPGNQGMFDKLFIEFHRTYSRVLVHLAIRQMDLSNVSEKVDRWP